MHKGDYHTDYSKYYDKEYKDKDLAFEHIKELKQKERNKGEAKITQTKHVVKRVIKKKQRKCKKDKVR